MGNPVRALHAMRGMPRWLIVGFVSGALSVLVLHQGAIALLHALELTSRAPYPLQAVAPWGVPQVLSLAFWGGAWGAVLAATLGRRLWRWGGDALVIGATVFGAVLPTLVTWFVVAPLKDQPLAAGGQPTAMAISPIVNAAWGLGVGFCLAMLARRASQGHVDRRRP